MRKEALIGISVLLVMFSGSATVLNSFGVISGEASVEPSVEITNEGDLQKAKAQNVEIVNNLEADIPSEVKLEYDGSKDIGDDWSNNWEQSVDLDLSNSDNLKLMVGGKKVQEVNLG